MAQPNSIELLNQLLAIEYRSLAMYLSDTWPGARDPSCPVGQVIQSITSDQRALAERIADLVHQRGGMFNLGEYPMKYTGLHDLSADYLLGQLVESVAADIVAIEPIVAALADDRAARELAEEALGSEKAHLEAAEAALRQPA